MKKSLFVVVLLSCLILCTSPTNYDGSSSGSNSTNTHTTTKCDAVQCHGTTQKGTRCKNRTTNCSGYCYLHN